MTESVSRQLPSESATAELAKELALLARAGDVILLSGDLGAGKSVFARAFINALPGPPEEVPSPTFTLVQTYQRGRQEVWHFDLYRLESPDEAWELGFEEALANGISLIEWPERLGGDHPPSRLEIEIRYKTPQNGREASLTPFGDWCGRLGKQIGQDKA
ncbi:MAG: tRNA (adenosine(37)-N6)-threonylcarbamoyltransferase complex ATPase subunit type 1 TsaE [Pseudomonadota bacterium]